MPVDVHYSKHCCAFTTVLMMSDFAAQECQQPLVWYAMTYAIVVIDHWYTCLVSLLCLSGKQQFLKQVLDLLQVFLLLV